MSDRQKLVLAVVMLVAAGAIYFTIYPPFRPAPGAGKLVKVDCQECGYRGEIMLDKVLGDKSAVFSGETGWMMPCPKCKKMASVHPEGVTVVPEKKAAAEAE